MVKLTFHGGVNEIGGNKILLQDGDSKIFLDFGRSYGRERLFYDEPYLSPREETHLLSLGILPEIEGLYKRDERDHDLDAILVTHPHKDHLDYIRYVKDDVPIYCGETTRAIIVAREFSGKAHSSDYQIASLTKTRGEEIFKEFMTFRTGNPPKEIGSIEIEPIHVDHSVPGAYGFILHTSDGCVVYTGDFRLHGPRRDMSEDFIRRAMECRPDAMIIEGTNIVEARISSEEEVKQKVGDIVSKTSKLVLSCFSTVDVDRLMTFYAVARENGRRLVISTKQAFLLDALRADGKLPIFGLSDPNIRIFVREKKRPSRWESEITSKHSENVVESSDLRTEQDENLLVASYYDMNEISEVKPEAGSVYILSQSEPFNEEMEMDYTKLINWLEHYGLPLYNVHASGHAYPHQLKEAITEIAPRKLFLVHTDHPHLYKRYISDLEIYDVICPKEGLEYVAE